MNTIIPAVIYIPPQVLQLPLHLLIIEPLMNTVYIYLDGLSIANVSSERTTVAKERKSTVITKIHEFMFIKHRYSGVND